MGGVSGIIGFLIVGGEGVSSSMGVLTADGRSFGLTGGATTGGESVLFPSFLSGVGTSGRSGRPMSSFGTGGGSPFFGVGAGGGFVSVPPIRITADDFSFRSMTSTGSGAGASVGPRSGPLVFLSMVLIESGAVKISSPGLPFFAFPLSESGRGGSGIGGGSSDFEVSADLPGLIDGNLIVPITSLSASDFVAAGTMGLAGGESSSSSSSVIGLAGRTSFGNLMSFGSLMSFGNLMSFGSLMSPAPLLESSCLTRLTGGTLTSGMSSRPTSGAGLPASAGFVAGPAAGGGWVV